MTPYDLAITKTSDVGTGSNDTIVTYTINYANIGGNAVSSVRIDDIWPELYLDFISSSPSPTQALSS